MNKLTDTQEQKLSEWLAYQLLSADLGSEAARQSIATMDEMAREVDLYGSPVCFSRVIESWLVPFHRSTEVMSDDDWRRLLPFAVAARGDLEKERFELILNWLWSKVTPEVDATKAVGLTQPWREMYFYYEDNDFGSAALCAAQIASACADFSWDRAIYWERIDPRGLLIDLITIIY